ncbi:MAG: acyl-CoA thioesterase [Bdellovibrionaceae bacterium]|nr:acyl-CoA thioesterase [Pseudobdellovibrionaceae bacterium]
MDAFQQQIHIRFRQTDMAGIAYFNEAFNIFHDVYEAWVEHHFKDKSNWFANSEWAVPLKNVSAEYQRPLLPFATYTVRMQLHEVGKSSFQLHTEILSTEGVHAKITTTHVFMNKATRRGQEIPNDIRRILEM